MCCPGLTVRPTCGKFISVPKVSEGSAGAILRNGHDKNKKFGLTPPPFEITFAKKRHFVKNTRVPIRVHQKMFENRPILKIKTKHGFRYIE